MNTPRPFALAVLATLSAVPAAAMSPWEAAEHAASLGRPVTSYVNVPSDLEITLHGRIYAPGGDPLPIYLNRFGGSYTCGDDDSATNRSSVVCGSDGGDVGPFSGSNSQWNQVLGCVQDMFQPFNVYVTDLEPTSDVNYVEAVVGGTPGQAGMPNGVGGVAPFSCGLIPNGIVYAFSDVYGNDMQGVCETVAQEVAHAFGLDHQFLCEDPMTYLGGCGNKSFQNIDAACGEFEPRECQCGGSSQNSVQSMLEILGASDGSPPPPRPDDQAPPTVSLASPAADAILPANSTISISATASDDVGLTLVELELDFTGETFFCPATVQQTGNYECFREGNTYTWSIQVGAGSRTFRAHVRDPAGNEVTSEDRTIWLSEDGSGPPDDNAPPDIIIASPLDGAVLEQEAAMDVVATIADDAGIARADLVWTNGQGDVQEFPCPMESQGVGCVVEGNNYKWTLQVGTGSRSFFVRAQDVVGNVTESGEVSLDLRQGAPTIDDENDDTIDRATSLSCGDSRDLDASDVDWFVVDAPKGHDVEVTVNGEAKGNVALLATTGPTSAEHVAEGESSVDFEGKGEEVRVGVLPNGANAGAYTIEVTCTEIDIDDKPLGCASTSAGGLAPLALALVALARRRRRAA